jgi:hypothetical protein
MMMHRVSQCVDGMGQPGFAVLSLGIEWFHQILVLEG